MPPTAWKVMLRWRVRRCRHYPEGLICNGVINMVGHASPPVGFFDWGMNLPSWSEAGLVHVVVDTPKGSSNKYKYDPQLRLFKLSRVMPLGMHFPCDFGAIPSTAAADGDALDVAVITEHPSFTGCLLTVRLIGVLEAEQMEKGRTIRNDRLVAVPETPVNKPEARQLRDLPKGSMAQLEQFFVGYNRAHGRQFKPLARRGPRYAEQLLRAAIQLHVQRCGGKTHDRGKTLR
jgi:inorganic pyrophosphatase